MRVVLDGLAVRQGTDFILEHFLMDTEVCIRVRIAVVSEFNTLILGRHIAGARLRCTRHGP